MTTFDLKQHVRNAIRSGWEEFAAQHPRLVEAVDQELLVESALQSLADDPQFQRVLIEAQSLGLLSDQGLQLIRSLAREILALA